MKYVFQVPSVLFILLVTITLLLSQNEWIRYDQNPILIPSLAVSGDVHELSMEY